MYSKLTQLRNGWKNTQVGFSTMLTGDITSTTTHYLPASSLYTGWLSVANNAPPVSASKNYPPFVSYGLGTAAGKESSLSHAALFQLGRSFELNTLLPASYYPIIGTGAKCGRFPTVMGDSIAISASWEVK